MVSTWLLLLTFIPVYAQTVSYDPLKIHQPSLSFEAEKNGLIGIESGAGGDVHITPGANDTGSVFLDGEDLLYIIQVVESKPPVWENHLNRTAPYGYLGEFKAGQRVAIQLDAKDPEGTAVTYQRVAGDFPPGIRLYGTNNRMIGGVIPDADAMYSFTIRATDGHGKFADAAFRMVVRGTDNCSSKPCQHEGVCSDVSGDVKCRCVAPYGGTKCNLNCRTNPLGIQQGLKYVSDSQMTAYKTYASNIPWYARIGGSSYWIGQRSGSYLQIDFRNETEIHRIDTVRGSTYYYTNYFFLEYSLNGNDFHNYTSYTGATVRLPGSSSSSVYSAYLPSPLTTRYVRIHPTSYYSSSGYYPALKLEMYGCYHY